MKEFGSWEEVIVNFFETRIGQSELYKARNYIEKKEKDIKKEKNEKKLKTLVEARDKKQIELISLRKKSSSTQIRSWLEDNAKKSGCIMKATHILKFSYTSSAPEGIYSEDKSTESVLSTSSLIKALIPDLAHSDGALISVSRFLNLEFKSVRLIDLILDKKYGFLNEFPEDETQLASWKNGFTKLAQKTRKIQTTDKAKQIYFPLNDTKKYKSVEEIPYHLITPLFPSSLSEELYQYINTLKFGEEQKIIKEHHRPKKTDDSPKFHTSTLVSIANRAIQHFGGEYPRNVSMLNANRQGSVFLFTTQPPIWEKQLKPPTYKVSLFENLSNYQINEDIKYLIEFLQRFKYLDLSYKDPKRYAHLERWVESIVDEVLYYANSIQKLPASWSADDAIKLKIEHQYFLDPYRDDDVFQASRSTTDWQTVVRDDFASWINRKLVLEDKKFTPLAEHTQLWKNLFKDLLREDTESIKAEKQYHKKEVAQ